MGTSKELDGPFIETWNRRRLYFNHPGAGDYDIDNIIYSLSNLCRFNGHTRPFYSVAQHSLWVAGQLQRVGYPHHVVLGGLLHDAAEAYVGDNASPLKDAVPDLRRIEYPILQAIYKRYGLDILTSDDRNHIKIYDTRALCVEGQVLMSSELPVYHQLELEPDDYQALLHITDLRVSGGDDGIQEEFKRMFVQLRKQIDTQTYIRKG